MFNSSPRAFVVAVGAASFLIAGAAATRAEDMDHSKMDHSTHGAAAPVQWADPGKGVAPAAPADAGKSDARPDVKPDDHAGMKHDGMKMDGMKMGGMKHEGGGMGGMGGMMGGMGHGGGMDHGSAGGMSGGMSGGMGGMMKNMMCGFADHLEGRIAYLKAELKLTDAQTGAWNAFADAWRAAAQKATAKCAATDERMDHSKPAVLHKLGMMESHMTDHLDIVRAQKAAIEPLFTALSEEQRKIASDAFANIMKVGMSMGGGMGSGGMGGGGMGGMQH